MINYIQRKRNKKGFTLIELIVVIAILGILAAIAIPRFSKVQDNAKIDADAATSETIISAARIFDAQENELGAAVKSGTTFPANLVVIPTPQTGGKFLLEYDSENDYYTVKFGGTVEAPTHIYKEETSKATEISGT